MEKQIQALQEILDRGKRKMCIRDRYQAAAGIGIGWISQTW